MQWLVFVILWLVFFSRRCHAADPIKQREHISPEDWIENCNCRQEVLMLPQEIKRINSQMIKKSSNFYDMLCTPAGWTEKFDEEHGAEAAFWAKNFYRDGQPVDEEQKAAVLTECALAPFIKEAYTYAVTVRRSNIRRLPFTAGWFASPEDAEFDVLQETALDPSEALYVLHHSRSGKYCYVQAETYCGWILRSDIAFTDRPKWLCYVKPAAFITVLSGRFFIKNGKEELLYQMGARIPVKAKLSSGVLLFLPTANDKGRLVEQVEFRAYGPTFQYDSLPFTRENILRQAFHFIDEKYGWGGLHHAVDCSGLIMAVYRTVGIRLPRDAAEQEKVLPIAAALSGLMDSEKRARVYSLQPGDLLFLPGHVMLYLGSQEGEPFVLHALGSYTLQEAGKKPETVPVMRVVSSDLSFRRKNGETLWEALRTGGGFS